MLYQRRLLLLLAVALVATATSAIAGSPRLAALEAEQIRIFERVAPGVVFIASNHGFGSGFIVDASGLTLTNAHVVGKAKTVDVVLQDGRRFVGKVVETGDDLDLALVQIPLRSAKALEIGRLSKLRIGSWVASVGHGTGAIWTYNTGMVSNIYPAGSSEPVFQTQIPLNPGSSGGPIVDRNGAVVGIVTAGLANANNLNFGINIDVALTHLKGLEHLCNCFVLEAPPGAQLFVDGTMVGSGPRAAVNLSPGKHVASAVIDGTMTKRSIVFPRNKKIRLSK